MCSVCTLSLALLGANGKANSTHCFRFPSFQERKTNVTRKLVKEIVASLQALMMHKITPYAKHTPVHYRQNMHS